MSLKIQFPDLTQAVSKNEFQLEGEKKRRISQILKERTLHRNNKVGNVIMIYNFMLREEKQKI